MGLAGTRKNCQPACKPGSVWPRGLATAERGGHSSGTDVAIRLARPTRMAGPKTTLKVALRAIPIRSCSRWGLPCRPCCQARGGLLPHPFTLTPPIYRPVCRGPAAQRGRYIGGAVCFLWHFPWGFPRRLLAGTVFPWSPDFPPRLNGAAARPTGRPYKDVRGKNINPAGSR